MSECMSVCVSVCVCVCVYVCYHIFSDIAYLYAATIMWISFVWYTLEYSKHDFLRKSFVHYLRCNSLTALPTDAIATIFCLILS